MDVNVLLSALCYFMSAALQPGPRDASTRFDYHDCNLALVCSVCVRVGIFFCL
jgi:hypothetical protein